MRATYLYGDGRPSHYTSNVLDLVEAAMAFAVPALRGVEQRNAVEQRRGEREEAVASSLKALQRTAKEISLRLRADHEEPAVVAWSIMVERDLRARLVEQERELRAQLARELNQLEAEMGARKESYRAPLVALLGRRDFPGAIRALQGQLSKGGYAIERVLRTPWGLSATLSVETRGTVWEAPARAAAFDKRLTIKLRGQPLARALVASFRHGSDKTTIGLRHADGTSTDVVLGGRGRIFILAHADARPTLAEGLEQEELARLAGALQGAFDTIEEQSLAGAAIVLDERPVDEALEETVRRVVAQLAADVAEIARRSPVEGELVLKRLLDGNRREEIFLDRRKLAAQLRGLSPAHRSLLEPLGAGPTAATVMPRVPTSSRADSTPAGPRRLPRAHRDHGEERTAHGPGTPSTAPNDDAAEATLASAGVRKPGD